MQKKIYKQFILDILFCINNFIFYSMKVDNILEFYNLFQIFAAQFQYFVKIFSAL